MKKLIFFAALVCCTVMSINAQLRIKPTGYMVIGPDSVENICMNGVSEHRKDTISAMKIYGKGTWGGGGRISFGDQCKTDVLHVMVGEQGNGDDSDALWLHGRYGLCITMNNGALDTLMSFDPHTQSAINFGYPIKAQGVLLSSDGRLKENVHPVEGALSTLASVNGVTYHLKTPRGAMRSEASCDLPDDNLSPKDKEAAEFFKKYYSKKDDKSHYGFIAQELQRVLPDLVYKDENGYLSVDYIGMIPILVNAINELNAELEVLKSEKEAETENLTVNRAPRTSGTDELLADRTTEVLSQNTPNPFSSDTSIGYHLPDGTQQAAIYIYDLQGKQVKRLDVDASTTSVTLQGGDLQAGMYIYSLIADGRELASKKMILTK